MSNARKDTTDGLDPADDEALWRLLGRARGTEVSPYFARRVLREVTLFEEEKQGGRVRGGGWLAGLRGGVAASTGGGLAGRGGRGGVLGVGRVDDEYVHTPARRVTRQSASGNHADG